MFFSLDKLERDSINTIRFLSADAIEKASSGHPGTPMGAAPMMYLLWQRFLRHAPGHPDWPDRDRFVLSNGHASMLLYSLLHLTGYSLTLEDIQQFRQFGSLTPGHPEVYHTAGVEVTTGPLGQGFSTAVGMALAEAILAARYNRPDLPPLIDHYTYVIASDGDLMEGVTAEAASFAGHLRLHKLIVLYDDNQISIDGSTDLTFSEDRLARFAAYGWHTEVVDDAHDLEAVVAALNRAQQDTDRPSILSIRSIIGFGAPAKAGTEFAHAGALGDTELRGAKRALDWPENETFFIPEDVRAHFHRAVEEGEERYSRWQDLHARYREVAPAAMDELARVLDGDLPPDWDADLPIFEPSAGGMPTRLANGPVVNALAGRLPELIGGSADLSVAISTIIQAGGDLGPANYLGRNIHFGVREHAMGAILNGLCLHGGLLPYGATFLTFYDYMRPAVRMAAMMEIRPIILFSHDSIGLGEDGPTHQPVEHLFGLRSVPNLTMIRPCDANETVEAWKAALMTSGGPVCIALSRQPLPILDRSRYAPADGLQRGAYTLADSEGERPAVILIATGSEVHPALDAQEHLRGNGVDARVVAMPSWELFEKQSAAYREQVLPEAVTARVSIEAGSTLGWQKWVGRKGLMIGLDRFGASAPQDRLFFEFGFSGQHIAAKTLAYLEDRAGAFDG